MSGNGEPIEVAVVGVGRMGKHHALAYGRVAGARLVAVVDGDQSRAEAVAQEAGCTAYKDVEALLAGHPNLAAASVAVPTVHHAAAAEPLLRRGVACLVEKPLAPTVAEARALTELAGECGAMLQVGHTERFNPAVRAVQKLGIEARFIEVERISPMTFRSLDVGVVMDLMIHDLDIVLALARSPLSRVDAVGVAVFGAHEDVANARLVFESGCVANLTASRLALKTERKMRLFNENAYVSLDYSRRDGVVVRKSDNAGFIEEVQGQLAAGADLSQLDYSRLVHVEQLAMDEPADGGDQPMDPLTLQLVSFVDAIQTGGVPVVDGAAGYAAVDAAERVRESIGLHRWPGLEPGTLNEQQDGSTSTG